MKKAAAESAKQLQIDNRRTEATSGVCTGINAHRLR
jgi:hypothetical protein